MSFFDGQLFIEIIFVYLGTSIRWLFSFGKKNFMDLTKDTGANWIVSIIFIILLSLILITIQ